MTIAVTGASGPFGRHAIEVLLGRGIPADQIVAIVRDPAKVEDLREQGVAVRRGDYSDPATLRASLAGVDRLLFVSGSEVGQRIAQHQAWSTRPGRPGSAWWCTPARQKQTLPTWCWPRSTGPPRAP